MTQSGVRKSLAWQGFRTTAAAAVLAVAGSLAAPLPVALAQQDTQVIPIAPDAPSVYVVQKGDTLWDISAKFLTKPWYWPEIWYVNPQVENPHLIYPGDELTLTYVDGQPRLVLSRGGAARLSPRVREMPLGEAITTIPYDVVAAFMNKPSVLDKDEAEKAPYVLASKDDHLINAVGNTLYVRGIDSPALNDKYSIYRLGDPLKDPETGDVLGYHGSYSGAGFVTRTGDPSSLLLTESSRETLNGDRLYEQPADFNAAFVPRAPGSPVEGAVMHVVDGVTIFGQYQVVVINRGTQAGLEPGHVLEIWRKGEEIKDTNPGRVSGKVKLPDERAGQFMVFKAYPRMSYGLVMNASNDMREGDIVRNPE